MFCEVPTPPRRSREEEEVDKRIIDAMRQIDETNEKFSDYLDNILPELPKVEEDATDTDDDDPNVVEGEWHFID